MSCEHFRPLLGAYVDGQPLPGDRSGLETHLAGCARCRAEAEGLRELDGDLRRAFAIPRAAAARAGERVAAALSAGAMPVPGRSVLGHSVRDRSVRDRSVRDRSVRDRSVRGRSRRRERILSLASMAVGFLVAVLLFQPWKPQENAAKPGPNGSPASPAVARLVIATDPSGVEVEDGTGGPWRQVVAISSFVCPSEGSVRTRDDVRCELVTSQGSVVRMNGGAEITFHSAGRLELKRGEIWCRSSAEAPLEVQPSLSDTVARRPSPAPSAPFCCPVADASCVMSVTEAGDKALVTAAVGFVSVKVRDASIQLQPREAATITGGQIDCQRPADRLLAVSWMQPLLVRKGHDDPELAERVDDLLARIGQTRVEESYEAEIRSLGEYGVVPLLRYVQSPRSRSDGLRRFVAMRIVSDLAPAWAIGDLIGLLTHPDPEVRVLSALALQRLTQQTRGIAPETWRGEEPEWEPAAAAWQAWWSRNRDRYPTRVGVARPGNSVAG